ncbi:MULTISPECIES: GNAT family N-acetyltransferase [unclassified Aureimonas]|uniref:GNAT family N-acetyltransferase n=1 Tax=unclassified Aureimonas TaxID=2615206 RepID=UPI0006F279DF|nr:MULTISPECIES: GNAT family N-acetyltransferase [unclassified Aureimonas]KQT64383.1 hypothetical protein ASG62_05280 [Aureimonas sp. Leaf427]KQT81574.1 hypothetical protein ASG54_02555 [Aureimonas sp. Leaf460]
MTDRFLRTSPLAPEAQGLIEGLAAESARRYGIDHPGNPRAELERYPAQAFVPPLGDFLVLLRNGQTIGGGAFMSHDDETAELKRIWTHPDLRRQGIARRVVEVLETGAALLGYTRVYLTTGFRQPEAVALYLSLGYRPLFDVTVDPALFRSLPFEKHIGALAGKPGTAPVRKAAASLEESTREVVAIKAEQERQILARLDHPLAAE